MRIRSPVFAMNETIPARFTGEGEDQSPPLTWSEIPSGTRELVLICEDPDAPNRPGQDHPFVHWVAYHIPPTTKSLPEGLSSQKRVEIPVKMDQGVNSFGKVGYCGPMPPLGHGVHHYRFKLYALNAELDLKPGVSKRDLLAGMKGHILETAEFVGIYERGAVRKVA